MDFLFQLTNDEKNEVVANCDHLENLKFSSTNPYVFTEHGVIMAASVLNSPKAIEVSVHIVRTFVKLRQLLNTNVALKHKLIELENHVSEHDHAIKTLVNAIHDLMNSPAPIEKPTIGFASWKNKIKKYQPA